MRKFISRTVVGHGLSVVRYISLLGSLAIGLSSLSESSTLLAATSGDAPAIAADELPERGLPQAEFMLDTGSTDLYLIGSIREMSLTLAAVHRVEENTSIVDLVPLSGHPAGQFRFAPSVLEDFKQNIAPAIFARFPHVKNVEIRHFARGFHRIRNPESPEHEEFPIITTSFEYHGPLNAKVWAHYPDVDEFAASPGVNPQVNYSSRDRNSIHEAKLEDGEISRLAAWRASSTDCSCLSAYCPDFS